MSDGLAHAHQGSADRAGGGAQAGDIIAGMDRCFVVGFGRLGPEQSQCLQALGRSCSGTPLKDPVSAAIEALARNEFVERHFAAIAAARAALQGAQYDALRKQAAAALGRTPPESAGEEPASIAVPDPVKVWQESTRHWLMELAIAGFGQLEPQTLAPFAATLEQLQAEPLMTRLAALLTGFRQELLARHAHRGTAERPRVSLGRPVDASHDRRDPRRFLPRGRRSAARCRCWGSIYDTTVSSRAPMSMPSWTEAIRAWCA